MEHIRELEIQRDEVVAHGVGHEKRQNELKGIVKDKEARKDQLQNQLEEGVAERGVLKAQVERMEERL